MLSPMSAINSASNYLKFISWHTNTLHCLERWQPHWLPFTQLFPYQYHVRRVRKESANYLECSVEGYYFLENKKRFKTWNEGVIKLESNRNGVNFNHSFLTAAQCAGLEHWFLVYKPFFNRLVEFDIPRSPLLLNLERSQYYFKTPFLSNQVEVALDVTRKIKRAVDLDVNLHNYSGPPYKYINFYPITWLALRCDLSMDEVLYFWKLYTFFLVDNSTAINPEVNEILENMCKETYVKL